MPFEVLSGLKLLDNVADLANKAAPAKVGNYPINDPKGQYLGQALAGYGLMWNTRYLAANKLPAPAQWADLARPVYFGHVAMSSPVALWHHPPHRRDAAAGRGLGQGLVATAADRRQLRAITERSFGVPDGVNNGQYGIGLVIDFFGLAGKYSGFPVEFAYPDVTAVVLANIGADGGEEPRRGEEVHRLHRLSRKASSAALTTRRSRACRSCRPRPWGKDAGGLSQRLRDRWRALRCSSTLICPRPLQRGVADVRPDHHPSA